MKEIFSTFEESGIIFMKDAAVSDSIFFHDFLLYEVNWSKSIAFDKKIHSRKGRKFCYAYMKFEGFVESCEPGKKGGVVVLDIHELKFLSGKDCKALVHEKYLDQHN